MMWRKLKRLLRLQIIEEGCLIPELGVFGRGLIKGRDRWGADDRMLYWVALPCWSWEEDWMRRRFVWHRAWLFFHGEDGFKIHWVPDYER